MKRVAKVKIEMGLLQSRPVVENVANTYRRVVEMEAKLRGAQVRIQEAKLRASKLRKVLYIARHQAIETKNKAA